MCRSVTVTLAIVFCATWRSNSLYEISSVVVAWRRNCCISTMAMIAIATYQKLSFAVLFTRFEATRGTFTLLIVPPRAGFDVGLDRSPSEGCYRRAAL